MNTIRKNSLFCKYKRGPERGVIKISKNKITEEERKNDYRFFSGIGYPIL